MQMMMMMMMMMMELKMIKDEHEVVSQLHYHLYSGL